MKAAIWAVAARFLIHGLIVSTWVSRIPAIQSNLGLQNTLLGLCLLGTAVGSVAAVPLTGWLVTKFGSKRITSWSTAGFCIALVAPALAMNAPTLFAALTLYGAMAGANDVSMNSQAVAVENALATPVMSRFHALFSIGGMLGAALGGFVASHEISPAIHLACASAVLLGLSLATAPRLLEARDESRKTTHKFSLKNLSGALVALAIIGACLFLSEGAIADWAGVYLKQTLHSGSGTAAAAYAVFSAGMALFRLLGDAITKRLGPVLTVRTGALLGAAGLTLALLAPTPILALPGFALTGAGFSVIVPLAFGAGGRVTGIPQGAGVAMVSGSGYIGFLAGPALIGFLSGLVSLRAALFLIVGLSLLAAALAKAVGPGQPLRRTAEQSGRRRTTDPAVAGEAY